MKRLQKLWNIGTYQGQFVGVVPMQTGKIRLRFLVYNDKLEDYETYASNSVYSDDEANAALGVDRLESASHEGYEINLGKTYWEQNTILSFKPRPILIPGYARQKQNAWQSLGNNRAEYIANRRLRDEQFNLQCHIREETYKLFRGLIPYSELIGTSSGDFRLWLTIHLPEGFGMKDYAQPGGWELDHVTPLSRFDLTNDVEMIAAAHYSNVKPMSIEANREKYNNV